MSVYAKFITGVSVGFELHDDMVSKGFTVDLLIVRLAFLKDI